MSNINNFFLQKGGNTWTNIIKSIFKQNDIPYNPLDYIYIPTAEAAWQKLNKDIDNTDLKNEDKIRIKKDTLEVMIEYINEQPERNINSKNWKIKNKNGDNVSPADYVLELGVEYLNLLNTTINPVDSLKINLQSMVNDVIEKQEGIQINNQELNDINNLINILKENLQKINTTSTESVDLNNLKLVLEKAISKISENDKTGIENNSDIVSINNLINTLNSDLNNIRATPVAKNKLLELKKLEAQLRLFKKKLSEFLSEISKRDNQKGREIISANKNILNLEKELKELVKVFSQNQIGGELKDLNSIVEKNELIPKAKYNKDSLTRDNFILNCGGHKWSICDEYENIQNTKKKWIKAKLNMGWIKSKYELLKENFSTLEKIRVLFKIDRDENQYTFIKGKKAYLILKELDNFQRRYLTTKLLDYNTIHYLKKNINLESVDYIIINVEDDNAEQPKTKKEMFPEIWNRTDITNRIKQEEQKKEDDKNLLIKKLYFEIFKEKEPLPLPEKQIPENTESKKLYSKKKLVYTLPQSNLVATEDENGNLFYVNNYDGSKVDYNFGDNLHYKVYDDEKFKKFNLFDEEWQIVENLLTPVANAANVAIDVAVTATDVTGADIDAANVVTNVAGKVENVIVPENFVLIYDYENEAFFFNNVYTGFRYWGIPLLKYSTDTFFVSYSPHFNSIYIMDMLKFDSEDDDSNDFVINSFEPDEFIFKLQINILKILEYNRNKKNFDKYKSLFESINELSNKFSELKSKIDSLTKQYANNTEVFKIKNELIKLEEQKNKLESDLNSISSNNISG